MGKTKKIVLVTVLAGSLVVTAFLLYQTFGTSSLFPAVHQEDATFEPAIQVIDTSFDHTFLQNQRFAALQQFTPLPIAPGPVGRPNPFVPPVPIIPIEE